MSTSSTSTQWTPVRDGARYCSPACGAGCTWAAYQAALRQARALCQALAGLDTWQPCVWESLGWHAEAQSASDLWTVRRVRKGRYEALFTGKLSLVGYGVSPTRAVAAVCNGGSAASLLVAAQEIRRKRKRLRELDCAAGKK